MTRSLALIIESNRRIRSKVLAVIRSHLNTLSASLRVGSCWRGDISISPIFLHSKYFGLSGRLWNTIFAGLLQTVCACRYMCALRPQYPRFGLSSEKMIGAVRVEIPESLLVTLYTTLRPCKVCMFALLRLFISFYGGNWYEEFEVGQQSYKERPKWLNVHFIRILLIERHFWTFRSVRRGTGAFGTYIYLFPNKYIVNTFEPVSPTVLHKSVELFPSQVLWPSPKHASWN